MTIEPGTILIAEDDPQHAKLIRSAFSAARLANPLEIVGDGGQAIAYLESSRADSLPELILLDLHMPVKSGLEVLSWVREQPHFKHTPVIMLTSSQDGGDIREAYDRGATSYLVKPVGFDALLDVVKTLEMYWLVLNQRPNSGNGEKA